MCPLDRKPVNEMTISPSNLVLKRYIATVVVVVVSIVVVAAVAAAGGGGCGCFLVVVAPAASGFVVAASVAVVVFAAAAAVAPAVVRYFSHDASSPSSKNPGQVDGDLSQLGLVRGPAAARLPVGPPQVPLLRHPRRLSVRRRRLRPQGTVQDHGQAPVRVQVQERR